MSEIKNIKEAENEKLKLENDLLKARLARMEKRFILIPKLRKESRVAGYIWTSLSLTKKLMDCDTEAEMQEHIRDAETVTFGEEQSGEVEGMGAESDVADYVEKEITEEEKTKIKDSFKIIEGGKK